MKITKQNKKQGNLNRHFKKTLGGPEVYKEGIEKTKNVLQVSTEETRRILQVGTGVTFDLKGKTALVSNNFTRLWEFS